MDGQKSGCFRLTEEQVRLLRKIIDARLTEDEYLEVKAKIETMIKRREEKRDGNKP